MKIVVSTLVIIGLLSSVSVSSAGYGYGYGYGHDKRITLCHHGKTIKVKEHTAYAPLEEGDYEGECKKEEQKEETPVIEEVTPETPIVEEVKTPVVITKVKSPTFKYSQGANGKKGDGLVQIEYKLKKNVKNVTVAYKYKNHGGWHTKTEKNDGSSWLKLKHDAYVKIKGNGDYSKTKHVQQ